MEGEPPEKNPAGEESVEVMEVDGSSERNSRSKSSGLLPSCRVESGENLVAENKKDYFVSPIFDRVYIDAKEEEWGQKRRHLIKCFRAAFHKELWKETMEATQAFRCEAENLEHPEMYERWVSATSYMTWLVRELETHFRRVLNAASTVRDSVKEIRGRLAALEMEKAELVKEDDELKGRIIKPTSASIGVQTPSHFGGTSDTLEGSLQRALGDLVARVGSLEAKVEGLAPRVETGVFSGG